MKRTEILQRVGEAYGRLERALAGLTEEEAARVGLTPQWSVKDCLAHIAAWEIEGARVSEEIVAGTYRPRYDDAEIERRNTEAVAARRALTLAEIKAELHEAHERLTALLARLPDEIAEDTPGYRFIAGVTFDHMTHHAAQIEKYRES
jgi:DinB superfamily